MKEISERKGIPVEVGHFVDRCDSLHIYGKDLAGIGGFAGLLEHLKKKTVEELTWTSAFAQPIFEEARHRLAAQLEAEKRGLGKAVVPEGIDLENFPYPADWAR